MQNNNSYNNQSQTTDTRVGARSFKRGQTQKGGEKLTLALGEADVKQLIELLQSTTGGADGVFINIYPGKSKTTGREYAKIDAYSAKPGNGSPSTMGKFVPRSSAPVAQAAPVQAFAPAAGTFQPRKR